MVNQEARIDVLAAALADPSRSRMVFALMDGRAYTAKELAYQGRISAQTASFHLQKLVDAGIIERHQQGRHRYHHIANEDMAAAIEALSVAASATHLRRLKPRVAEDIRLARSCYNHLAGRLGVAVAGRLIALGTVMPGDDGLGLTDAGRGVLAGLGLDPDSLVGARQPFARQCMDWTERKFHFSGALGHGLLQHFLAAGWLARKRDSRVLEITPSGGRLFQEKLGIAVADLQVAKIAA